jgi:hypothetical protein
VKEKGEFIVVEVHMTKENYEGIQAAARRDSRDPDHILNVAIEAYLSRRDGI